MYRKTVLPNGVRIVTENIPYIKSVSLGIWVDTGSRHESEENHGISHFIEHLMFKGTPKRSAKDIAETVDAVGGQLNAFTAKEYTCYYIKVLDTHLKLAMDVLSDMLLNSKFDEQDILREKEVVLEEVNMYEDDPDELVHDLYLENVWRGHPLGHNILGTMESINRFDRKMVMDYYTQYYTPDNIVIVAAGNLQHESFVELTKKYFLQMTGTRAAHILKAPCLTKTCSIRKKETEQVHFCLGTTSVPQNSPDIYSIHILNNILGGGISSRLFQSIREEKGLAYSVYSYQTNYSDAGLFTIYAGTRPSNAVKVIDLILEIMFDIKRDGITGQELTKSKEQLKGSIFLGLENSSSRMARLGKLEVTLGKFITPDEVVNRIDSVTLENVKTVCDKLFKQEILSFMALGSLNEKDIIAKF